MWVCEPGGGLPLPHQTLNLPSSLQDCEKPVSAADKSPSVWHPALAVNGLRQEVNVEGLVGPRRALLGPGVFLENRG